MNTLFFISQKNAAFNINVDMQREQNQNTRAKSVSQIGLLRSMVVVGQKSNGRREKRRAHEMKWDQKQSLFEANADRFEFDNSKTAYDKKSSRKRIECINHSSNTIPGAYA
jgi:hypothetical protein